MADPSYKQIEVVTEQADEIACTLSKMHAQSWALLDLINCHEDDYGSNDERGVRVVQLRHLSSILHDQLTAAKGRAGTMVNAVETLLAAVDKPGADTDEAQPAPSSSTVIAKCAACLETIREEAEPKDRTDDIELEVMQVKAILALIRNAHEAGVIVQTGMRTNTLEGGLYGALRGMDRIAEMLEETRTVGSASHGHNGERGEVLNG